VVDGREGKEVHAGMITLRISRLMICTIWVERVEFGIEGSIEAHDEWKPHAQKLELPVTHWSHGMSTIQIYFLFHLQHSVAERIPNIHIRTARCFVKSPISSRVTFDTARVCRHSKLLTSPEKYKKESNTNRYGICLILVLDTFNRQI
jgi:hypothetical protein